MVQNKKKAVFAPKPRKPKRDAEKKFGKNADMTEFRAQLDSFGLKIIEVTADGNCFFRAMGDQLEGNEEEHMKYRAMIVQYIVKHREEFEPFIEDEVPFDKYCDSMLQDGTWAGHMELQAASLLTRRNICIHMLNSPRWYIHNFSGREATNMVHLSYHHGEHYNSVRLREDPCEGPAMPVVIKVLEEMDGDVDAAIEYMIAERLAMGSDDVEVDPFMDYVCDEAIYFIEDELSTCQDENQMVKHKEGESCYSKDKTVQKSKSSNAKEKSKTNECSCKSARKHKASCSLATAVPSREPPRTKGSQGKGQKGKKQKKKEQAEAAPVQNHESVAAPDLGALCI